MPVDDLLSNVMSALAWNLNASQRIHGFVFFWHNKAQFPQPHFLRLLLFFTLAS